MSEKIGFLYPVTTWSLSNSIRLLLCYHTYYYIIFIINIIITPWPSLVFDSACHFCCNITYAVLYTLYHVHRLRAIAPTYWIDRRLSSTSTNHRRRASS